MRRRLQRRCRPFARVIAHRRSWDASPRASPMMRSGRSRHGWRSITRGQVVIRTTRRTLLCGAAIAAATALAAPAVAQAKPRIVVLGGGFGGATCARMLRRADPRFEVTLVEPNPVFTACPFSNSVITGLRDIAAQRFGYDGLRAEGIAIARDQATAVDPQAQRVNLRGGSVLDYDRLVLAPGIA